MRRSDGGDEPGTGGRGGGSWGPPGRVDVRAAGALPDASVEVVALWRATTAVAVGELPSMGLAAGDRPVADVEMLAGAFAAAEFGLARRMHAALAAGCLPLADRGGMLAARGWSIATARRLARCGALSAEHPSVAAAWAAGIITSEHVDPIARIAERLPAHELAAVIAELDPHWGSWSPAWIHRFVNAALRMLHPPADPTSDEADAHEARFLSFSVTGDSVLLSGSLPSVEGELVIAAIDALAEKLRSTADHVPSGARRADALVELVNTAHASGVLPSRGGLPVALTVTLDHTALDDSVWTTSRGHQLTESEARWAGCDADVTPLAVTAEGCCDGHIGDALTVRDTTAQPAGPAARIAALAALLFQTRIPLAVGRTQRTATPAQRRALAVRDQGCVIPGCGIPAEACQAHHLTDWAAGGDTDLANLALLCWAHHRQVDLCMWSIAAGRLEAASPEPGAPPGTPWPANHGAPFTITRIPRHRWRT